MTFEELMHAPLYVYKDTGEPITLEEIIEDWACEYAFGMDEKIIPELAKLWNARHD